MSNLSAFPYIEERSQATPGLWNAVYSVLSANIQAVDSNATPVLPSGETFSFFSNVSTGGLWATRGANVGIGPSSGSAMLTLTADSSVTDYLFLQDSSGAKSNYIVGSNIGPTADGLNFWDDSGQTMLMTLSKQSIRFWQNVVGPVFDVGGSLADTYNAATFGTGADSNESRIQAAIDQASTDGISRVYIPANLLPYSASSVSFVVAVQMVREGGSWGVYDVRAYGAVGDGVVNDSGAMQSVISYAAGLGPVFISQGTYSVGTGLRMPSNTVIVGDGYRSVIEASYITGKYILRNQNQTESSSGDSTYVLKNFRIRGGSRSTRETTTGGRSGGVELKYVSDFEISQLQVENSNELSIAMHSCKRGRITNNLITGSQADGITGWLDLEDLIIANNTLRGVGDDGIAINATNSAVQSNTTRPRRITVVGNTIFGQSTYTTPATGRGIAVLGAEDMVIVGNSITNTHSKGIYVVQDAFQSLRPQRITITGNTVDNAGAAGDGSQSPAGINVENADYIAISANIASNASGPGLKIQDSQFASIKGNSFISNGKTILQFGIDCSASTNSFLHIDGNTVYSSAGAGIFCSNAQQFEIANNTIVDNGSVGTGALDQGSGILIQGTAGRAPSVRVIGNTITDTRAAANKTQTYGIRCGSTSNATFLFAHNRVSGNSGQGIRITGTPNAIWQYGNDDNEVAQGNIVGWWSPSAFTAGTALLPGMSFASEVSLGWFRSGVSTMALSYGTLNLNQARLVSAHTLAPASVTTSSSVARGQIWFTVGASGVSIGIESAGTLYWVESTVSAP